MGYSASAIPSPRIFTNKSIKGLLSNAVWLISGEGGKNKSFYLAAAFRVTRESPDTYEHPGFRNTAFGDGHIFGETIKLNSYPWFPDLKARYSNFSLSLSPLSDLKFIKELQALAGPYAL